MAANGENGGWPRWQKLVERFIDQVDQLRQLCEELRGEIRRLWDSIGRLETAAKSLEKLQREVLLLSDGLQRMEKAGEKKTERWSARAWAIAMVLITIAINAAFAWLKP